MRRIMIDSAKCDGCKSCSLACMQAHRETPGTIYDLDVTDCANDPEILFIKIRKADILRFSADTVINRSVLCPV